MAMWKQQSSAPAGSMPEPYRPGTPDFEPAAATAPPATKYPAAQPRAENSIFTNGITVRGEISGPDAIYVDGTIEGAINIPGERVTVGPNGVVAGTSKVPCITAREIIVLGTVRGNIVAMDRLEIRANGSVTGNVSTMRLKIEDGSHFQGGIDIREPDVQAGHEPAQDVDEAVSFDYAAAS